MSGHADWQINNYEVYETKEPCDDLYENDEADLGDIDDSDEPGTASQDDIDCLIEMLEAATDLSKDIADTVKDLRSKLSKEHQQSTSSTQASVSTPAKANL